MMKDFFKKINKNQNEIDDLDTGYDNEYYQGAYDRHAEARTAEPAVAHPEARPEAMNGGRYYEEPIVRPVERPVERSVEPAMPTARGWQEADAPSYRERNEAAVGEAAPAPTPAPARAEAVFTPEPAPEYMNFSPTTYRDCREAIVRGLATGHVVVVHLVKLGAGDVLRLFDYMMGAVQALDGELARPRATTVVLLPNGVELDEDALGPDDASAEEEVEDDEYEDDEYEDDEYEDDEYEDGQYDEDEYDEDEEDEYDDYDEDEEYEDEYHDGEYGDYDDEDEEDVRRDVE